MEGAQAHLLPEGNRLHLHHGPIDLIIKAFGSGREAAYQAATLRFDTILTELVSELPQLRKAARKENKFAGRVACRMQVAVEPYCPDFLTPMAAVAGAVADEILTCIQTTTGIRKAYVNNGGDVAFHIGNGETINAAMAELPEGRIRLNHSDPFRGIATSGWRGRSFSFGIADSVSVVAKDAASADVAATVIANAVTLENCPVIKRKPANELLPNSDLGELEVTVSVGKLSQREIDQALESGSRVAQSLFDRGLIGSALLQLGGDLRQIGFATNAHFVSKSAPTRIPTNA